MVSIPTDVTAPQISCFPHLTRQPRCLGTTTLVCVCVPVLHFCIFTWCVVVYCMCLVGGALSIINQSILSQLSRNKPQFSWLRSLRTPFLKEFCPYFKCMATHLSSKLPIRNTSHHKILSLPRRRPYRTTSELVEAPTSLYITFNSVKHCILLQSLFYAGINVITWRLIRVCYSNLTAVVKWWSQLHLLCSRDWLPPSFWLSLPLPWWSSSCQWHTCYYCNMVSSSEGDRGEAYPKLPSLPLPNSWL